MKKKAKQKDSKNFDERFDDGEESIDFSSGIVTEGLSKAIKLSPMDVPDYLAVEIEHGI